MNLNGKNNNPQIADMTRLIEALAKETYQWTYSYNFKLSETKTGQEIQALKPDQALLFVLAAMEWLDPFNKRNRTYANASYVCVQRGMLELLRRKLPFNETHLIDLLDWSLAQDSNYSRGLIHLIKVLEDFLKDHELSPELHERVDQLSQLAGTGYVTSEDLRYQARLRSLIQKEEETLSLATGEIWVDAVMTDLRGMSHEQQVYWVHIFNLCAKASGSSPSAKWLAEVLKPLEGIGYENFKQLVLTWFPLTNQPRFDRARGQTVETLLPTSVDVLRALVWICSIKEDREMARGLTALAVSAYRKVPGIGPRASKLGNACVWALGNMPGTDGVGQLAVLKVRVKFIPAQKAVEAALLTAAKRLNLPADEIEEMSVPSYGLEEVGSRREFLADYQAELIVEGSSVDLRWYQASGKKLASAPKVIRDTFGEDLKELTQAKKDIEKMLPAQAARIENLYLEQKSWKLPAWRERYLDHPLVGTLARRLIWKFTRGEQAVSGIWWEGNIVDGESRILDWLDDETRVELWHPIFVSTETVLTWREWLDQHQVRQPFKQAHREIYLLTDAERQTVVYSNRYAAHIIKQHQFHALCGQRSWKNKLRLMVDDDCPPATRLLPLWDLRAEFWIESAGDNYGTDTNESGSYLYLSTDQVRFYRLDAPENSVHAMGGGYHAPWRQPAPEPLLLDSIPPLVFSEIMRDVDLFVGVSSVGNDPAWLDGGRELRYVDYWSGFSFGTLTESAKTRKQVLEKLIPRLKIASRCSFNDRFLVVRGDLRTYKIHLGSGNILMEPNDQYLCIVPARGVGTSPTERIFLPFEGDQTLSTILSKAFLLAEDKKITDPTITRQIGR